MTQEEAKKLWPIVKAYSEGKTIEYLTTKDEWVELKDPGFNYNANMYRIKPDSKYRPFKNADECFKEMKKHEPFGWMQNKQFGYYMCISMVDTNHVFFGPNFQFTYQDVFDNYIFVDGEPFGIKED